jgi:hypothetical protein
MTHITAAEAKTTATFFSQGKDNTFFGTQSRRKCFFSTHFVNIAEAHRLLTGNVNKNLLTPFKS